MPIKRTYADHGDACATAHALELVGDRWNYPVIRELMMAPKRFRELARSVRGITSSMLATRLRELEESGLVRKVELPPPAGVDAYELTDWAKELKPILQQLGQWAQASPTRSTEGAGLTPDATVQAMQTMAPPVPMDPPIEIQLHLYDSRRADDRGYDYLLSWGKSGFRIRRGTHQSAAATVTADSTVWIDALLDHRTGAVDDMTVDGDRAIVRRLVDEFSQSTAPARSEEPSVSELTWSPS